MLDKQKHFDTAWHGVLAQGGPSISRRYMTLGCRYRMRNGRKCNAGHNIPDELYSPKMEGTTINAVARNFPALAEAWGIETVDDYGWLHQLQFAHDQAANYGRVNDDFEQTYKENMRAFAKQHKLTVPEET